ncbi:YXWGXW repeat-containing protein [Paludisphaera soli]|uniref:YXWGXW repeat-containing protein n=1 Tax=Paludisphaera soli TaxID=2712865 RepID=UPI0013EB739F|nr:YXWGXW repeat-containing protein [Paludisphaera soli]
MDQTSRGCNQGGGGRTARTLAAVWLIGLSAIYATARAQGPATADAPDGVEVLTRGPVHEAFAVPVVNDPRPGLVVPRTPPDPVEEMPPDQKPAGDQVQWMPGYWSWDQGREDFVWVSGIWREPPPGRQWVPGYWNPVANGAQWIPGAWIPVGQSAAPADANVQLAQGEAAYLPEPPASLELGPNIPRPSTEVFWSPGCWFWRQARYVWRPGFWAAVQPTWVWVPAHYVWTPGGCLFVEGYWDLPLVDRGILFAPVYYARPVYLQPAYVYTPTITIASPGLVANLFVQPTYNHYCFGDYYDTRFLSVGVFPWFSFTYQSGPRPPAYYDPLFTFYASVNVRSNPGWASRCRDDYILRRDNIAMRPPRTYIEQTRIVQNNVNITNNVTIINQGRGGRPGPGPASMIGRPIEQVAMRRPEPGVARMERLDVDARRNWQARSRAVTDFRVQRAGRELEAAPRPGPGPGPGGPRPAQAQELAQARPRPFAMPASPVSAPRLAPDQRGRPGGLVRPVHPNSPTVGDPARPALPRHVAGANVENPGPRPGPVARPGQGPDLGRATPLARTERREPPTPRGPARPIPGERPAASVTPPQGRIPAAPLARHQVEPGASRPAPAHLRNGAGPAPLANRPPPAAPPADRPFAPRHLREDGSPVPRPGPGAVPGGFSPHAQPPRSLPRRPPPTPRPEGQAARAAAAERRAEGPAARAAAARRNAEDGPRRNP